MIDMLSRGNSIGAPLQKLHSDGYFKERLTPFLGSCEKLFRCGILWALSSAAAGCSLIMPANNSEDSNPPDLSVDLASDRELAGSRGLGAEGRASLNFQGSARHRLPDPPLQVTREVKREIIGFLRGDANCIRVAYERRSPHLSTVQEIFRDEGIPHDMMNLAVIESRFSTEAKSRSGALGIWQFTRGTAKMYGLKIEGRIDQRQDPILSTLAAARLLRDLYERYSDWYLALAAYNAGPGVVDRAISKNADDSFWALARGSYFSKQTKDFVPRFIAATIIMKVAEKYGMENLPERVRSHLAAHGASLDYQTSVLQGKEPYADSRTSFFG